MKKITSLLLLLTLVISTTCLTSCSKKEEVADSIDMKLGIGVHKESKTSSAEESKNGALENVYTVAAVVLGSDNKIIKCKLDAIETSVAFTKEGKGVESGEFKSKREMGDSYVMSPDPDSLKWYEQADAFAKLCEGKTPEEVKSLAASGGKGNADVISAGCTITVSDFVSAIEKSLSDLKQYNSKKTEDIKLIFKVDTKTTDATSSGNGTAEITGEFTAASLEGERIVITASKNDKSSVSFNSTGVVSE